MADVEELPVDEIPLRKSDHIDITTQREVTPALSPGWDDIHLVHQALPEIDLDEVELGVDFLGHHFSAPFIISSMTGGHPRATEINRSLARAAQAYGLGMGVGSQRAAVRRPELLSTYAVAREAAPTAFIVANVGAPQLIAQDGEAPLDLHAIQGIITAVRGDALAVHLNYLQEVVQPEGDTHARGALSAIERLARGLTLPVIAKETGAGMSHEQAKNLQAAGVAALDVGGAGGTSFALVESFRAADRQLARFERLGQTLGAWGIPTAASLRECAAVGLPLIATGGVRNGLDAAKALALGANLVGLARPMLTAALEGYPALEAFVEELLHTLRAVMFLCGARTVEELRNRPRVITGFTAGWISSRGLT